MALHDIDTLGSGSVGGYFKPADYLNSLALLVEPKEMQFQVPDKYRGTVDQVVCDITVFDNQKDVDSGEPSKVLENYVVKSAVLVDRFSQIIDSATIVALKKESFKNGNSGYVPVKPAPSIYAKVAEYYEARDQMPEF